MRATLLALVLLLAGCGGSKCAGPYTGHYASPAGNLGGTYTATVSEDCSFTFQETAASICSETGTFSGPIANGGQQQLSVASSTGSGCAPVGTYACDFVDAAPDYYLRCQGQSELAFVKQ